MVNSTRLLITRDWLCEGEIVHFVRLNCTIRQKYSLNPRTGPCEIVQFGGVYVQITADSALNAAFTTLHGRS
jgi:hypothetical protein